MCTTHNWQQRTLARMTERLDSIGMLPELHQALQHLAAADTSPTRHDQHWGWLIPAVQAMIMRDSAPIDAFAAAWNVLYAAAARLDHLQDNDPVVTPLPVEDSSAQYNLLLGYYVLATSFLDDLPHEAFPYHRIMRLRRVWSDMVLRMASGQHRDVLVAQSHGGTASLDDYQQLAHAKTGALFALAFGGTALLLSDDDALGAVFTAIGERFGMLVQCQDDLLDAPQQAPTIATLPHAFAHAKPSAATPAHTVDAFWSVIYRAYMHDVRQQMRAFSPQLQQAVLALFTRAFAPQAGDDDA